MTDHTYLVVWRDDGPVLQSKVFIDNRDPTTLNNNDWVHAAALSEEYSDGEADELVKNGYDLYLVVPTPTVFYGD